MGNVGVSSVSDSSLFQLVLFLKVYRPLPVLQFSSVTVISDSAHGIGQLLQPLFYMVMRCREKSLRMRDQYCP